MDFASKYLKDNNYVAVYKRKGRQKHRKSRQTYNYSGFRKQRRPVAVPEKIDEMPEAPISPVWLNFEKDIAKSKVKSVDVLSVKNTDNDLFRLYYYFDAGKWNNKILPLAAEYLQYLGQK
jgi:hypothetical protein